MRPEAVTASYARWAPVYDRTFGALTQRGRRAAVAHLNRLGGGRVLEVGVGTGLALPLYDPRIAVTGIDYSAEMLAKAHARVAAQGLGNVTLRQMDARALDFPEAAFDAVAAMHVLSVVPEPERVMAEIARVLKPGGEVVITNHFARQRGALARLERLAAPLENLLGWHSDFEMARILGQPALHVAERRRLPPLGLMTFLVLRKAA